ncbi:MAG: gene transfer agent family protein [Rhodobacteraceae bacterium]|nr:MAG: gene transfer agent family protein [Paracoccaceae bacterium]
MANRHAGEVSVTLDGAPRRLRLTLGALAELEEALGAEGLVDFAARIERGGLTTRDVIAVLQAGLRGAGDAAGAEALPATQVAGGALGAAAAAVALLEAAFAGDAPEAGA